MSTTSTTPTPTPTTATATATAVRRRVPATASHGTGFWFAAVAFAVLMAFGTAPTPLWPLYAARDHFGSTTVTLAFAALVVGAAGGFLLLGHLSDRFGRRRVVAPALGTGLAAALLLGLWPTLPGLLAGRLLNGVAIGLMASTATAYLHDLHHQSHPDAAPGARMPGVVATAANLGGLALGPLVGGVLAQWAPHPLAVVQLGFAGALLVSLALALSTPETVDREARAADRPRRFALRPGADARVGFGGAAALGFFSFALLGLVTSLGAILLRSELGVSSHLMAGVAPFTMFAASAAAQLAFGRVGPGPTATVGGVLFPAGLGLVALSVYEPHLWLFLLALGVAGAGAGLLFKSGVVRAGQSAAPDSRAGVLAAYFASGYVGMGGPSILFSVITHHVSVAPTMAVFASVLSVGAVASVLVLHRRAHG